MVESWVLIEEQDVDKEKLKSVSLMNAKHLVVGSVPGSGIIMHVAANSPADVGNAVLAFAQVKGVTGVLTLALRTRR